VLPLLRPPKPTTGEVDSEMPVMSGAGCEPRGGVSIPGGPVRVVVLGVLGGGEVRLLLLLLLLLLPPLPVPVPSPVPVSVPVLKSAPLWLVRRRERLPALTRARPALPGLVGDRAARAAVAAAAAAA
jgi:hypothetical protein